MPKLIDETGNTYGRWSVRGPVSTKKMGLYFECECVCGVVRSVRGAGLRAGNTRSCGCLQVDKARARANNMNRGKTKRYTYDQGLMDEFDELPF